MLVKITQKDIDNGIRNHILKCPARMAIKRKLPVSNIIVTAEFLHILGKTNKFVKLPNDLVKFLEKWDKGLEVKPSVFEIKFP